MGILPLSSTIREIGMHGFMYKNGRFLPDVRIISQ